MRLSAIEFVVAVVFVFLIVGLIIAGAFGGEMTPRDLCLWKGGVPIVDKTGMLTSCDFPVNIYRP